MTTSAREDRRPRLDRAAPDNNAVTPPPKLRRRPALVVAAVAVTGLGCLIGAWAWTSITSSEEVLAARETIHRGQVIEPEDLERVRISGDSALRTLPASAYDDVVGQRAALDVAAGGLLTAESTADDALPPSGQSIVGISLTPAQLPALPLRGGDTVRIVATPADGEAPAAVPQFTTAEVVEASFDEVSGNTVVNVVVPHADAATLAARAATGNVVLVLDSEAD